MWQSTLLLDERDNLLNASLADEICENDGAAPLARLVSASMTERSAFTCGAKPASLIMRRSDRVMAGPP